MSDAKKVKARVEDIVSALKKNPSARFSKSDFQTLLYGVLSDPDFKSHKVVLHNDDLVEELVDMGSGMRKFLHKVLQHAGVNKEAERSAIIDTFEYGPRDIEWVSDAVDEAMSIYVDCGKNMKIFRDKMLQLSFKKMTRSGKYDGKVTYKKTVVDRAIALERRRAAEKKAEEAKASG